MWQDAPAWHALLGPTRAPPHSPPLKVLDVISCECYMVGGASLSQLEDMSTVHLNVMVVLFKNLGFAISWSLDLLLWCNWCCHWVGTSVCVCPLLLAG